MGKLLLRSTMLRAFLGGRLAPVAVAGDGAVTALARCSGALGEHTKGVVTRVGRDQQLPVTEIDRGTASGRDVGPLSGVLFAFGGNLGGAAVGCGRLCDQPLCETLHYRGLTAAGVFPIR